MNKNTSDNSFKLNKHRLYQKYNEHSALKTKFILTSAIVIVFIVLLSFASCKTCKCPAYTKNNIVKTENYPS